MKLKPTDAVPESSPEYRQLCDIAAKSELCNIEKKLKKELALKTERTFAEHMQDFEEQAKKQLAEYLEKRMPDTEHTKEFIKSWKDKIQLRFTYDEQLKNEMKKILEKNLNTAKRDSL